MSQAPHSARLQIRPADDTDNPPYEVLLDGAPLQNLLAADGLKVYFDDGGGLDYVQPVVEMRFAPGALFLDLDAKLVTDILRHNEGAGS